MLGAVSLDLFAVLLGGAVALLPVYARDILDVGPWGLGLLRAAPGVGAVAMALYLARLPDAPNHAKLNFAVSGAAPATPAPSPAVPASTAAPALRKVRNKPSASTWSSSAIRMRMSVSCCCGGNLGL